MDKENEEKIVVTRKTKGICSREVRGPEFRTKVSHFMQQLSNKQNETFIYRKKNYQAGIAI